MYNHLTFSFKQEFSLEQNLHDSPQCIFDFAISQKAVSIVLLDYGRSFNSEGPPKPTVRIAQHSVSSPLELSDQKFAFFAERSSGMD